MTYDIQTILIRCEGSLGELVLMLPSLRALKSRYPWHVTVETTEDMVPVFQGVVDEVVTEPPSDAVFDRTVILGPKVPLLDGHHRVTAYRDYLNTIGIPVVLDEAWRLPVAESVREYTAQLLREAGRRDGVPLLSIQLGSGVGKRLFDPEKYADYIHLLRTEIDIDVCMMPVSEQEQVAAARLAGRISDLVSLPQLPISDRMGVLAHSDVVVGVDTGIVHLAGMIGTPVLGMFPTKSVKPDQWGPWQTRHFIIRDTTLCHHGCPKKGCPLTLCSDAISIREMSDKTQRLLQGEGTQTWLYWAQHTTTILILGDPATHYLAQGLATQLEASGIRTILTKVNDPALVKKIRENDISIIHNVSGRRRWIVAIAARLATLKYGSMPLMIHQPDSFDKDYYERYIRRNNT